MEEYVVHQNSKHLVNSFGQILYWLIHQARQLPIGTAMVVTSSQHIALIQWLGLHFGYKILYASDDLDLRYGHRQLDYNTRLFFKRSVIIVNEKNRQNCNRSASNLSVEEPHVNLEEDGGQELTSAALEMLSKSPSWVLANYGYPDVAWQGINPLDRSPISSLSSQSDPHEIYFESVYSLSVDGLDLAQAEPFEKKPGSLLKSPIFAIALYSFEPEDGYNEELAFEEDDLLEIIEESSALTELGWCRARIDGESRIGLVPRDYLEEVSRIVLPRKAKVEPLREPSKKVSKNTLTPIDTNFLNLKFRLQHIALKFVTGYAM